VQAFKLPDLGEGLTEGEVARWLVSEGQEVGEDDPLVEIQTDKATVEIPSPFAGTVLRILVAEGELVPVGATLVVIGEPGEETELALGSAPPREDPAEPEDPSDKVSQGVGAPAGVPLRSPPVRVQATPLVRRIAAELGVELDALARSRPGGRITEEDVRAAAGGVKTDGRREKLRGIRRVVAEHVARAHREVPAVTWVEDCDFESVPMDRLVAFVVKASASALAEFPELNARLEADEIVYLDRYDIGVAVQTEHGLVVPVVRGVDSRTVEQVHEDLERLSDGARQGTLEPQELRDSTFTVTSAGKLAGLFQTPIVNHPEVAILSIGRIAPRAVVRDGEVVVRRTGSVAVSFDHRVVDGARAAAFGLSVIARLEHGPTS
jgi:pyruvate dehydrogenase E2 component (dihydrolipoamide acetyltransferase)